MELEDQLVVLEGTPNVSQVNSRDKDIGEELGEIRMQLSSLERDEMANTRSLNAYISARRTPTVHLIILFDSSQRQLSDDMGYLFSLDVMISYREWNNIFRFVLRPSIDWLPYRLWEKLRWKLKILVTSFKLMEIRETSYY
ncbi:unnamed protein product [Caenorhabditis auriculariae]|uniref:Uncharacterized protein n=1 Tax=Caenorhabditis auriculariae TaxID=2777116 RepID=A0A8S1HR26_9PELO|nr:unnamed protein product [Caenorhabditis auriculariae]